MEIKNLEKAAERIKKAVKSKENIILYADADLDGVSSLIILKEAVNTLGGKIVAVYFPDREREGYGLSPTGLDKLKSFSPALMVILDCGITNFKEAKLAKKLKLEAIIVDHHEVLGKLPAASIIVDPKQKGDKYPFKGFATAGLAFKLAEALLAEKMSTAMRKNLLELTAIATIADMMPQKGENKIYVEEGLGSLKESWRPGFKALLEKTDLPKIISLLNIRDVEQGLPGSFRLLTAPSLIQAKSITEKLSEKQEARRERIREMTERVEKAILNKEEEPVIFEGADDFELTLMGSVASNLCQKYQKPVFLYKIMEKESQGTVRANNNVNSVELMKRCSQYLISFGGHPPASGFRVKNDDLEKFKKCLIKNYQT